MEGVYVRVDIDDKVAAPEEDPDNAGLKEDVEKAEEVGELTKLSEEVLYKVAVDRPVDTGDTEDNAFVALPVEEETTLPLPSIDGVKVGVRLDDKVGCTLPEPVSVLDNFEENVKAGDRL